jgi:hypothetical protein
LERFQKVAADPQFSIISRLPAFVAMEAALSEVISRTDGRPADVEMPVEAEELPLPAPQRPVPPQQPLPPQRDVPFLRPK